jgi:peptidoglycan/xylan/chitin deacetylase (PgdA/CDA1 family)
MTIILAIIVVLAISLVIIILLPEFLPGRIPILLYHRIIENDLYEKEISGSEKIFTIPITRFEEQMKYLKREGYYFLHLEELLDILSGKKDKPDKPMVITFDDGFKSVFDHAYPVLKKENIKATIFVTTDQASEFFGKYKGFDEPLSDEEMQILHENGISIQSHGHSHRPLVGLTEQQIFHEAKKSKEKIKKACGVDPRFIAIPGGFLNNKVQRALMNSDFDGICTSLTGTNSKKTHPHSLRRLIVEGTFTLNEFKKSLNPFNISMRRIVSAFKKAPTKIIDPYTWLEIRKKIYESRMGKHLSFQKLRIFLLIFIFLFIIVLILLFILKLAL